MTLALDDVTAAEFCDPHEVAWSAGEREAWTPRKPLPMSEWAERHRVVSVGPVAGPFRNDVAPFGREIQDAFTTPGVETVVVIGPVQTSKSTCAVHHPIGYFVGYLGLRVLYMMPTDDLAEENWRDHLKPMFEASPSLRAVMAPARDGGRRGDRRFVNNGLLSLVGANTLTQLISRSYEIVLCDDVHAMKAAIGDEGDPVSLARGRSNAYEETRRIGIISSVSTTNGIEWRWYLRSDQREYFVPCPHCDEYFTFRFDGLSYDATSEESIAETCVYVHDCGGIITDADKPAILRRGAWVPANGSIDRDGTVHGKPARGPRIVGFRYNSFLAPWTAFKTLALEFEAAQGDEIALRDFNQQRLAIPVKPETEIEALTDTFVDNHIGNYAMSEVPDDVKVITGGIDVHKRFIAYVFRGWTADWTSWLISAGLVNVADDSPASIDAAIAEVSRMANDGFVRADGQRLRSLCNLYDSGWEPDRVYAAVRRLGQARHRACRGRSPYKRDYNRFKQNNGVYLWEFNADLFKQRVHGAFRLAPNQRGFAWLPADLPAYYSRHILAERWVPEAIKDGRLVPGHWEVLSRTNHLLDCEAMARAAAAMIRIDRLSRPAVKNATKPTDRTEGGLGIDLTAFGQMMDDLKRGEEHGCSQKTRLITLGTHFEQVGVGGLCVGTRAGRSIAA